MPSRKTPDTPSPRGRLGLLEDDPVTADMLHMLLSAAGFGVVGFSTVGAMTEALQGGEVFDLLLLDWSLPDGTAASIIATVRNELRQPTPILIASVSDDEATIVAALERGADDYVAKPLRVAEVIARLGALQRRTDGARLEMSNWGRYAIDWSRHCISLDGQPIALTAREFALAAHFFRHADKLLSRENLLLAVWGVSSSLETRTVDAHVARLRSKVPFGPETGVQLLTEHGLGYRLTIQDEG